MHRRRRCAMRAPPREEHPRGTPEETDERFARMEVIQRWPERRMPPEELNRSEPFSRSYDGSKEISVQITPRMVAMRDR